MTIRKTYNIVLSDSTHRRIDVDSIKYFPSRKLHYLAVRHTTRKDRNTKMASQFSYNEDNRAAHFSLYFIRHFLSAASDGAVVLQKEMSNVIGQN